MDDIRRAADPQWQRKAQDRRKWKTSAEGYILQWMDKASKVSDSSRDIVTITDKTQPPTKLFLEVRRALVCL
ncbi:hypothetical protein PoB_007571900 [Plakobranchus ocellatus]|uniref:Uncharacterized protein n=1 Tax=Plakobranchus ocellatus TaxID=259542 RepID=A0AAV4DYS0_9GAST|nr:hypothetical protein PoB_007571900 [Plakobranchus ocellatus]